MAVQLQTIHRGIVSYCGGTIISDNYILSAAHCCDEVDSITINFGSIIHRRKADFTILAEDWYVHEQYKDKSDRNPNNFDVCIIKSSQNIFTVAESRCGKNCVSRACLPSNPPVAGMHCWIAGWGAVSDNERDDNVGQLRQAGVNIFSRDYTLEHTYYRKIDVQKDEFCAGLPAKNGNEITPAGVDSCQGDSGGPLICEIDKTAVISGVVSRGYGCAKAGYPGIYGNVFFYKEWIQSMIKPSESQNECCVKNIDMSWT